MAYRPFKNSNEFINAWIQLNNNMVTDYHIGNYGIWVKRKGNNSIRLITEISDNGVIIGNQVFITSYETLFNIYEFFNKIPCGVIDNE